jgi:MtN3 and saliva related transmembrane protein
MVVVGWFYTLCFAICYIPQIVKSLKTKKVNDVSVSLFILSLFGYISAIIYTLSDIGFNLILITNYVFGAICSLLMIIIFLCYRTK